MIDDVKGPRNLLMVSALGIVVAISVSWRYRDLRLEYAQRKYSRELAPGMTRNEIRKRLLSEGIRFFSETPDRDFLSVGDEVPTSLACAPREVGLLLEFEMRGQTSSESDVLRTIKPVREERGCM